MVDKAKVEEAIKLLLEGIGEDVDSDKLMDIIGDLPESYADYITPKEIEYLNDNRYMLKVREYLDSH